MKKRSLIPRWQHISCQILLFDKLSSRISHKQLLYRQKNDPLTYVRGLFVTYFLHRSLGIHLNGSVKNLSSVHSLFTLNSRKLHFENTVFSFLTHIIKT